MENISLLIVEDNNIVVMELTDRLLSLGYNVVASAAYGEEAIELAGKLRPDLILMDIRLKGKMDGINAAEEIKKLYQIPVVYLTAHTDVDTLHRAKITEPYGYIIKPFEERELHSSIEMALYKYNIEKKLKESEHWLSTTLRSIGDALIATDSNGQIKLLNSVASTLTGWGSLEATGKSIEKIFLLVNENGAAPLQNPVISSLNNKAIIGSTNQNLLNRNNKIVPIDFSCAPIKENNEAVTGAVLVFRDVTERIKGREALEKQRKFLKQIIDTDPNYIYVKDVEGKFELTNEAVARAFGTTVDQLIGKYDTELGINKEQIDQLRIIERDVLNSLEEKVIKNEQLIDAEGKIHLLQTFKKAIDSEQGDQKLVLSVASDITELKLTENALRESEVRIKALLKALPDNVFRCSKDGTFLDFHLQGQDDSVLSTNNIIPLKISQVFPADLSEKIMHYADKAFSSGEMQVFEFLIKLANGVVYDEIRIVTSEKDEFIIIFRDITQRKIAEKEIEKYFEELKQSKDKSEKNAQVLSELNEKLNKSEKELIELNAGKDKLFSIIAHDLRSPFNSLLGFSDFLANEIDKLSKEEIKVFAQNIYKATRSTFNLLENLLQWSRLQTKRIDFVPAKYDLKEIVTELVDVFQVMAIRKKIDLQDKVVPGTTVFADKNMLDSILRNLISNAIKFTHENGKVVISSVMKEDYTEITVEDNGIGMRKDEISKLFKLEVQFTTNGTNNETGSGLGLILCKEFVEQHRGKIEVESEKDKGTKFILKLLWK